ncbi:tetratricopeptide repeat protein [Algoriphagus litoralis]|uniref:tetratricopeptide repeat protein n=1 Tax=Algoriphagus litoralis TaxID=2202829 RepID=UPI0018E59B19|nr:tetratricopeptide repeat protein [Algoriphagus litoralis]
MRYSVKTSFELLKLNLIMLIAGIIFLAPTVGVWAQSVQSLQEELAILSKNANYAKDTIYLNKANELGFLLAETDPDSAFPFLEKQIELCRKADFKKGESDALKIYGNALQNKGDFKGSLSYYQDALQIAESLPEQQLVPGILNNIGLVNYNLGNYAEALSKFYEAIIGAENSGNLYVKAAALNNIASIYFEQEKLEEAKTKYREMLEIYRKLENQGRMILAYNNIGDVELKQNRPLEALENLKIGHRSALDLESPEFIEMTARTLAGIYAALDSTDKAELFYKESIAIAEEKGYGVPYAHSLIGLAELYYNLGNYDQAFELANKGLIEAQRMGQPMQLRNANELLAKIHEKEGNFPAALEKFKQFKQFSDSINNTQGRRLATALESEYEFSKKTLELEKSSIRQRWIIFSTGIGLLTFVVILVLVYQNRNRLNKAYNSLKEKNSEIENKNEVLENTLTQLKSAQQLLIQSEKMASLGELTAGIAHEIQNPLNFVNNFSELSMDMLEDINQEIDKGDLEEAKLLTAELKGNLSRINNHGKRAGSIVKGMLEHSRKTDGKKELTDLNRLAEECLKISFQVLRTKDKILNAEYYLDLESTLPKAPIVSQDISRVLLNLINNAIFFCTQQKSEAEAKHASEFKPQVKVSTKRCLDRILISVHDNGPGIPEQNKDKIFQPFFTTKPAGKGTGLGLSLSYDIVKAHGGELTVETKVGEGSTFTISLPLDA